ncbi:MAG TPA: adenylate/guanylate cyclase domain-containing protein [Actinomycetota bacterium]
MQVCPRCGDENSDRARFCQTCGGTLLAEPAGPREIRKTVTILFMDVVGSTELGERLDPESTRRVMSRLFDTVKPVLERHGSTVEKFIGDAVLAVFGVPAVHEDDARRACRAALEIQDEIGRLNKELERDWGMTIATRTGINTGEVLAGDPSSSQRLVTGDPVNTAARLEQAAPPGAVLIGESTYRLVADAVEVEPVDPVVAKGKADAVAAYRLCSVVPGTPVRVRRLDSPMVGRDRELRALLVAFERSLAESRFVLATVVGMPGVGKSRLVHEFVASIEDRATVLRGRCLAYGEGITFWPIAEVVRQAAAISEGASTEEARSRIEGLLPESEERAVIQDRLAAAMGLGNAAGDIHETFWAIRRLFESLAVDRPLIVVVDDIHWAEPTLLDLIEYLEGWSEDSPFFLLCLARPELLEVRQRWARAATRSVTIELDPLTGDQSDRLVQNLLGSSSVSEEFRWRVVETAGGNPLFVEEMLGMLIDEEQLTHEGDRWLVRDELDTIAAPPSVQSLLAARIERLPEEERRTLQHASVVGMVFGWDAVTVLSSPGDQPLVGSRLQALVRKGMIRPEANFAGQDAFRFHHILLRDAAYRSLPRATRAGLHERFAEWMGEIVGDRVEEYEEILGYHLEQACRQQLAPTPGGDLASRASRLLASAGSRAFDRDDIAAALNLLSRALELDPTDAPDALANRLLMAQALILSGDSGQANEMLSKLADRARAIGFLSLEWRAKIQQARLIASTTNITLDQITGTVDGAIETFTDLDDELGLSWCWSLLAWMHFNAGEASEAQKAASKSASHARSSGDVSAEMWSLVRALTCAVYGPTPVDEALTLSHDILDRVKGHPGHRAAVCQRVALLEAMLGNFEAARASITNARTLWQELGNIHGLAGMTNPASDVELYAGDVLAAERERRSGYEAYRSMGAESYQATTAACLADLLVRLDRDDEALELAREGEKLTGADDITAQVPSRMAIAKVLARRGAGLEAERLAREALDIAERTDWISLQGDTHMTLAEVLRHAGRRDEAAASAERAVERYERKGHVVGVGWARDLLREVASPSV